MNNPQYKKDGRRSIKTSFFMLFFLWFTVFFSAQIALAANTNPYQENFTSSIHTGTFAASLLNNATGAPTNEGFALANVSVVRLLTSYSSEGQPIMNCTGLGVLVESWPQNGGTGPNNWVLTDGSLLDITSPGSICATKTSYNTLSSQISIYTGTAYNKKQFSFPARQMICIDGVPTIDQNNCSSGPALVGFSGNEMPFLGLSSIPAEDPNSHNIDLIKDDGTSLQVPQPADESPQSVKSFLQNIQQYLIPQLYPVHYFAEPGEPVIDDTTGVLTGLHRGTSSFTLTDVISSLIKQIPEPTPLPDNQVNTNWENGIDAYYKGQYSSALADFQQAEKDNPDFQGARDFTSLAEQASGIVPTATSIPQQSGNGNPLPANNHISQSWSFGLIIIVIVVVLVLGGSICWLIIAWKKSLHKKPSNVAGNTEKALRVQPNENAFSEKIPHRGNFNIKSEITFINTGDTYDAGQVGAMGSGAEAENFTQTQPGEQLDTEQEMPPP